MLDVPTVATGNRPAGLLTVYLSNYLKTTTNDLILKNSCVSDASQLGMLIKGDNLSASFT